MAIAYRIQPEPHVREADFGTVTAWVTETSRPELHLPHDWRIIQYVYVRLPLLGFECLISLTREAEMLKSPDNDNLPSTFIIQG